MTCASWDEAEEVSTSYENFLLSNCNWSYCFVIYFYACFIGEIDSYSEWSISKMSLTVCLKLAYSILVITAFVIEY